VTEENTEIAKVDTTTQPLAEMEMTYRTLATLMAGPTMPTRYRQSPTSVNDALAAVLVGKEMGIGPMEAINSLYLVNGQVAMSGKLMSALVHRAGHQIRLDIKDKSVTAHAWRRDPYTKELVDVGSVTFSEADAKRAKLNEKDTYKAYPKIMWAWRATTALCRFYFGDVVSGISGYVPEELNISVTDAPVEAIPDYVEIELDGEDLAIENATAEVVDILDAEVIVDKT